MRVASAQFSVQRFVLCCAFYSGNLIDNMTVFFGIEFVFNILNIKSIVKLFYKCYIM